MKTIAFGKSWFLAKRRFTEIWDESTARIAHEQRKPYAAAVSNGQRIESVVEANNDFFGIDFLDDSGREFVSYQFQEVESNRLFLTMATHRDFEGETDQVKYGTTYYFKTDGKVNVEAEDFLTAQLVSREMQTDVGGNWEPYPKFGEYQSLTRLDR